MNRTEILEAIEACTEELRRTTVSWQREPITDKQLMARIALHRKRLVLMNQPWRQDESQPNEPNVVKERSNKSRNKKAQEAEA